MDRDILLKVTQFLSDNYKCWMCCTVGYVCVYCSDEDVNTEERLRALVEELEDRNKELEEDLALERERGE